MPSPWRVHWSGPSGQPTDEPDAARVGHHADTIGGHGQATGPRSTLHLRSAFQAGDLEPSQVQVSPAGQALPCFYSPIRPRRGERSGLTESHHHTALQPGWDCRIKSQSAPYPIDKQCDRDYCRKILSVLSTGGAACRRLIGPGRNVLIGVATKVRRRTHQARPKRRTVSRREGTSRVQECSSRKKGDADAPSSETD